MASFMFVFTVYSIYDFFETPKEWPTPPFSPILVEGLQQASLIWSIINFAFFLPFLYIAIKRAQLAKFKILGTVFLLYIITILVTSFIRVNG